MKLRLCAAFIIACAASPILHAQGCAQCRDNMQATPQSVQLAYRHAIELLGGAGVAVFAGGILVLRRYR